MRVLTSTARGLVFALVLAVGACSSGPTMSASQLERDITAAIAGEGVEAFVNCPDGDFSAGEVVECEVLTPGGSRQRMEATLHEEEGQIRARVDLSDPD